jgi:hypothetical protein
MGTYYATTPIYYVNDRPHIGHCYTSLLVDVAARFQRLVRGEPNPTFDPDAPGNPEVGDVFFLTGTDEHAEKVSRSAAEHGVTPMEWATTNAQRFKDAFAFMGFSNDDFVRTTEDRHTTRASAYIQARRLGRHRAGRLRGLVRPLPGGVRHRVRPPRSTTTTAPSPASPSRSGPSRTTSSASTSTRAG